MTGRRLLPAVLGLACLAFLLGVSTHVGDLERPGDAGQQLDAVMAQQPWAVVTHRDPSRLLQSQRPKATPLLMMAVLLTALAAGSMRMRSTSLPGKHLALAVRTDPAAARAPPR